MDSQSVPPRPTRRRFFERTAHGTMGAALTYLATLDARGAESIPDESELQPATGAPNARPGVAPGCWRRSLRSLARAR